MMDKIYRYFFAEKAKENFRQGYQLGMQAGQSQRQREIIDMLDKGQVEPGMQTEYSSGYRRAMKLVRGW